MKMMPGDAIIKFFASFMIWFLLIGLGVLWLIDGKIKKEQVIHAVYSSIVAWCVALIIKQFFPTVRPYISGGISAGVLIPPVNPSFPSEHTVIAFALSVTVYLHDKRVGWVFLVAAVLIGIARVLANVHYPIDILGGGLIGCLSAIVIDKVHFQKAAGYFTKSKKRRRKYSS